MSIPIIVAIFFAFMGVILFFADRFGWDKPNGTSIKDMQQKLLDRRL